MEFQFYFNYLPNVSYILFIKHELVHRNLHKCIFYNKICDGDGMSFYQFSSSSHSSKDPTTLP